MTTHSCIQPFNIELASFPNWSFDLTFPTLSRNLGKDFFSLLTVAKMFDPWLFSIGFFLSSWRITSIPMAAYVQSGGQMRGDIPLLIG